MPQIGGVQVSDDVLRSLTRAAAARVEAAKPRPGLSDVFKSAAEGAYGQVRYGIPYQVEKLAGTASPEDEQFYQQGLAGAEAASSRAAPAGFSDLTSGRVGLGRFVAENLTASVPYMVGGLAGTVAGGLAGTAIAPGPGTAIGAVAGAVLGGTPQFSASNVARAVQETGSLSESAAQRALAVAPLQSASDALLTRYLPGVGKVIGDLAAHQTGGFLRRVAVSAVEAAGTEAATEAAQQFGERYAAGLPVSNAAAAGEYVNAAATAFFVGGALGAGGGFRRSNVEAKPADQVETDELAQRIDSILDGSARATLALPAPADISVDSGGTARVNPSGQNTLALPSPDQFKQPDIYVDSAGRAAPAGEIDPVVLANMPRDQAPPAPTLDELQAQAEASSRATIPDALAAQAPAAPAPIADTSVTALTAAQGVTPPAAAVDVPDRAFRRIFASEPIADVNLALRAKDAAPELRAMAEQEVTARWAEAAGTEPLTAEKFQTRLEDVKAGLRGGWVQSLEASTPAELLDKVYKRIGEDADTSANVMKLAQRLGIVDEQLRPTELVQQLEARAEAAAAIPAPAALAPVNGAVQPQLSPLEAAPATDAVAEVAAQAEPAVLTHDTRNQIDAAQSDGKITEVRAQKLHDMLDEGKVEQVEKVLPKRLPTPPETVYERGKGEAFTGGHDAKFETAITGKDFNGVADHMIAQAPSRYHRELMRKVKGLAETLAKAGVSIDMNIVRPGDTVPNALNSDGIRALTVSRLNDPKSSIYLKSSAMGGSSGMNYQIAAHEMLHATTDRIVAWGMRKENQNTRIGKDVRDLMELGNSVIEHFNKRVAAKEQLSEFEQGIYDRNINAAESPHELIAWGMTNPDMQRYLQSVQYTPKQTVFGRFVELLRKLLGVDGKYDTALTELLRVSERITKPSQRDVASVYRRRGSPDGTLASAAQESAPKDATSVNDVTQKVAQSASAFVDKLNPRDMAVKFRRAGLGWISRNQIDRAYGQEIPSTLDESTAHREREALLARFQHMGATAHQSFEALENTNPNAAKWVGELMGATTEFQIDPDKAWDDHTWLHEEPNAAALKRLHGEITAVAGKLKRGDAAGWTQFNEFRSLNETLNYARMAVALHGLVATDPELRIGVTNAWENPADVFMRAENLNTAQSVQEHWAASLDAQVAAAEAFIRQKRGQAVTTQDKAAAQQHLSPVEAMVDEIANAKKNMRRAPYFHLGRFGDNFGSLVIRKGEDGKVDPAAQQRIATALSEAGFGFAQISADNTNPRIMLRFDTVDQTQAFQKLALALQKQKLLEPESEIKAGPRDAANNFGVSNELPAFVARYIDNLKTSAAFTPSDDMSASEKAALEKSKQEAIQLARDTWVESQPDNAISKVLTKRNTISGYDKNMVRNFAHRNQVGAVNIANIASTPKFNAAFEAMRAQYEDALVANHTDAQGNLEAPKDPFVVQDVMRELKIRNAKNPINETANVFDKARAFAHSFFLGFSPAYGLINMTQLGVTALPELAKKHGYSASFHAMRRASTQALSIVKAVSGEASKLGWQHWGDVAITDSALVKAGVGAETRDFVQHMLATGTIDIGSMARAYGQVGRGKGLPGSVDTYLRLSSAIGLYTETFSRLVTALAARELHGDFSRDAQDYATKTVSESMFDYQNWNTARQMGKKGFLGPATPLLTQFMSYQAQMTEKLYSEAINAFGKQRAGETSEAAAQRKTESRRFLLGHLTAITTLAGTMGLPFATVFATAIERIVDATDGDDEPFDATASYRNFLAGVFGKDMAEVLARGAPRAFGFDISARAGEQNLLPFSEFLADRRSWQDAANNSAGRSMGAAPSMLVSILDGGSRMADGDLLGGMKAAMPVAFKGPIEAYRMSENGYTDSKGNKLPMSPKATAYLWQLLGFSPAAKAEYGEARGDQSSRRGEIARRAGQLRSGIVDALSSGDREGATGLIAEAMKFDNDNPAFAVIPSIEGTLARRASDSATAQALQAPIGVSPKDIAGQRLTGYANTQ